MLSMLLLLLSLYESMLQIGCGVTLRLLKTRLLLEVGQRAQSLGHWMESQLMMVERREEKLCLLKSLPTTALNTFPAMVFILRSS